MRRRDYYPCTFVKACHIRWCVDVMGWSLTRTSFEVEVNIGTVSKVVRRKRFPTAYPVTLPSYMVA